MPRVSPRRGVAPLDKKSAAPEKGAAPTMGELRDDQSFATRLRPKPSLVAISERARA